MSPRVEEQITAIEYARARYRMTHATSENERIQMEAVVRWLGKKLDSYRRMNGTRVQDPKEVDNIREAGSAMRPVRKADNQR